MTTWLQGFWQGIRGSRTAATVAPPAAPPATVVTAPVDIEPNDPILPFLQSAPGVVDVDTLKLDSPALDAMRAAGVRLVLPLVNQGELLGLVSLGPRLSDQEYSGDDRRLLNDLVTQAAPAVRVAQLVRQQEAEARDRERIQQELRVARLIQQTLLPKEIPELPGWQMAAHYQPAQAVGGDFYDFFRLPDGRLGLVIGDVTDKGVPAALVMATTRAILRGASLNSDGPGELLRRANDLLMPDIPEKMFVTCLYAILDPVTGLLQYANAGHDLPYRRSKDSVTELRARGMPLGLMPGMNYEEREVRLEPGDSVLFYSDGLVEAHDPRHEMFGFPGLQARMATHAGGTALIPFLLEELAAWTGAAWEQEDDVTLLVLQRDAELAPPFSLHDGEGTGDLAPQPPLQYGEGEVAAGRSLSTVNYELSTEEWRLLAEFAVPSERGNERAAMERAAETLAAESLTPARLQRLKTAVAEATMNAIEHGNGYLSGIPVRLQVLAGSRAVAVRITDSGGGDPPGAVETPDIEAKLAGLQSPRGWGLFLIEKMVDEMHVSNENGEHTVELVLYREGEPDGSPDS